MESVPEEISLLYQGCCVFGNLVLCRNPGVVGSFPVVTLIRLDHGKWYLDFFWLLGKVHSTLFAPALQGKGFHKV